MKIAVPTRGTIVDEHFGHCEFYTVFSINEKQVIVKTVTESFLKGLVVDSGESCHSQEEGHQCNN